MRSMSLTLCKICDNLYLHHVVCSLEKAMSVLREALMKKGFALPAELIREQKEAEARDYLAAEDRTLKAGKRDSDRGKLRGELNSVTSVKKFRALAKKLLLLSPGAIEEVVRIAHAQGIKEKKSDGGAALIAQLLQARSALSVSGLKDEDKAHIINRTISKH